MWCFAVLTCAQLLSSADAILQGRYTSFLADHEVSLPRKVTASGEHVSHDVRHLHVDGDTHFRLQMGGEELHLELTPSRRFVAPSLAIALGDDVTGCHYQGVVRGHPGSSVALSACNGLVGVVRALHGEFWVEPAKGAAPTEDKPQPHVVFKREAVASSAGAARRKRRRKRRKHERNCGTRELTPARLSELRPETRQQEHFGSGRPKPRRDRWRRSTSKESHVEALLVADASMTAFHRDSDIETYLLTIMNMVSALYLDPSIGNPINVVVVRIILLEEGQSSLNVTYNADDTLERFCKWQQALNPPLDSHPSHHDVAILITRVDICAHNDKMCSTLGVAHVTGMCQPERSCNINEDNGITLAHTIAHELGHNFGMYHDTEKIGCSRRSGQTLYVMTPSFEPDMVDVAWSDCSRRDITLFLDKGLGSCLDDEPFQQEYNYPDVPAGAIYNGDQQCRFHFGITNTSVCSPDEICSKLWCVVDGRCTTNLRPAAPGTPCGKDKWCQGLKCVQITDTPPPVNGGWGPWQDWSACSRTCSGGISIRQRNCDNPVPAYGGKYCVGERKHYRVCNTEPCPEGSSNYRADQCSAFNNMTYNGQQFKWVPHYEKNDSCMLYCTTDSAGESLVMSSNRHVVDGTPCNIGSQDMCINGMCKHVGCDLVVDSNAKEDICGVCQGDGSQCKTFQGLYTRQDGAGYKEVVVIPSGSRSIKVEEVQSSRNCLAVGSATSKTFYLNGHNVITIPGEYNIAGSASMYERDRDLEKIIIPGPIQDDILIYMIHRGRSQNYGLRYEYTVPNEILARVREFTWVYSNWSECPVTCGGGTQIAMPICYEKTAGQVDERLCNQKQRPAPLERVCNELLCPTWWRTGSWELCSVTCGSNGIRKRTVVCMEQRAPEEADRAKALPDRNCEHLRRPSDTEPCPALPPCIIPKPVVKILNFFHNVSSFNGTYIPRDIENEIPVDSAPRTRKRPRYQYSSTNSTRRHHKHNRNTKGWVTAPWSECSVTCGLGLQKRKVVCQEPNGQCDPAFRPIETKSCDMYAYCNLHWVADAWSPCSATCGSRPPFRSRMVRCEDKTTGKPAIGCFNINRPASKQYCPPVPACPNSGARPFRRRTGRRGEICEDKLDRETCTTYSSKCAQFRWVRASCCRTCSMR